MLSSVIRRRKQRREPDQTLQTMEANLHALDAQAETTNARLMRLHQEGEALRHSLAGLEAAQRVIARETLNDMARQYDRLAEQHARELHAAQAVRVRVHDARRALRVARQNLEIMAVMNDQERNRLPRGEVQRVIRDAETIVNRYAPGT